MKIKNVELDFSFLNADDMERLENASKRVFDETEKVKDVEMSYAKTLRFECNLIDTFFDEVFGEGTSEKVFGGKNNLDEKFEAFEDVMKEKAKQDNKLANMYSKYKAHD